MLILKPTKNGRGQLHIFQYTCFQSFQIHQPEIMHRFEHTNHDNHQGFLVLILQILSEHANSLYQ